MAGMTIETLMDIELTPCPFTICANAGPCRFRTCTVSMA